MNMRTKTVLLVLFFGGLLLLWWADSARIPTAEQRRRQAGLVLPELIDVPTEEIRRVEILGGPDRLDFHRWSKRSWLMVEPMKTRANRSLVGVLVDRLKAL